MCGLPISTVRSFLLSFSRPFASSFSGFVVVFFGFFFFWRSDEECCYSLPITTNKKDWGPVVDSHKPSHTISVSRSLSLSLCVCLSWRIHLLLTLSLSWYLLFLFLSPGFIWPLIPSSPRLSLCSSCFASFYFVCELHVFSCVSFCFLSPLFRFPLFFEFFLPFLVLPFERVRPFPL